MGAPAEEALAGGGSLFPSSPGAVVIPAQDRDRSPTVVAVLNGLPPGGLFGWGAHRSLESDLPLFNPKPKFGGEELDLAGSPNHPLKRFLLL